MRTVQFNAEANGLKIKLRVTDGKCVKVKAKAYVNSRIGCLAQTQMLDD